MSQQRKTAIFCGAALLLLAAAAAAKDDDQALFRQGVEALSRGAYDDAVDHFELLADRGFVHPDASFDRGAAYVERARSSSAEPGDLGRAAAAFAETVELRPSDSEAEHALEAVRDEIARRRARQGSDPIAARPSLGRAIVALLPEDAAWGAAFGPILATVGLALRQLSRARRPRLTGTTTAAIGSAVLLLCGGLAFAARHHRLSSHPAVVVAPSARLLDETGKPLAKSEVEHDEIPEGASIWVLDRRGTLAKVEWGTDTGWISAGQLRQLATP